MPHQTSNQDIHDCLCVTLPKHWRSPIAKTSRKCMHETLWLP